MREKLDLAAKSPLLPPLKLTVPEMRAIAKDIAPELNENMLSLAYAFYFSQTAYDDSWTMSIDDLIKEVTTSEDINALLDTKTKLILTTAVSGIENGKAQMVGPNYSLMAVTTDMIDGSDEAMDFTEALDQFCKEKLQGKT